MDTNEEPQPKRGPGRPKGSKNGCNKNKPKGYGKKGRPTKREVKDLLMAKEIIENGIEGAYQKTHPASSEKSTVANSGRLVTPEVVANIKRLLEMEQLAKTSKENLEKFFWLVIARWSEGKEKTSDSLRAMENLKELVKEFKQHVQIDEVYTKSPEDIDKELEEFGIDLSKLKRNGDLSDGKASLN